MKLLWAVKMCRVIIQHDKKPNDDDTKYADHGVDENVLCMTGIQKSGRSSHNGFNCADQKSYDCKGISWGEQLFFHRETLKDML